MDADLLIEADGVIIAPQHRSGTRFWLTVPATSELVKRTIVGVLSQVLPG